VASAITDIVIGILQNAPDGQGKEAAVMLEGVSKIVLGDTLVPGVQASVDATGKAVADAATSYTLGTILKGGVSGDIGTIHLNRATVK